MARQRARNAVRRLLREQGVGDSPPIDVHRIARNLGIEVVERPELVVKGEAASGFLLRTRGRTICVLNGDDHPNRKRFTVAHEIGHYLLHPFRETYIDWNFRNNKSSKGTDRQEIEANGFAAELLMPEELIRAAVPSHLSVIEDDEQLRELARRFRVSPQAMTHHLTNLGLLGEE
jgi:Zn-dependent peptidase ImmA (M78 family)